VGELDLDAYELVGEPPTDGEPATPDFPHAAAAVVVDGHVVRTDVDQTWADAGVVLAPAASLDDGARFLGSAATEPTDLFAELNDAFSADPLVLHVPDGVVLDQPVAVVTRAGSEGGASFPRLVVDLGRDAEATVYELQGSESRSLVAPVVELGVGPDSRLRYVSVQMHGPEAWQIASLVARVDDRADLLMAHGAFGGDYARLRTDCRLAGRGANGSLLAAYFGERDQMLDLRTFQDHAAPDTTSELLFKGAVADRSQSVYTGLIRVRPDGRGTDAHQTNRIIKLSEDAWAESVPNLEIENNDVRCAHASAVGPVDEDQRFYLESRGVPPQPAERLVVSGFFEEVLRRVPVPAAAAELRAELGRRLARELEPT